MILSFARPVIGRHFEGFYNFYVKNIYICVTIIDVQKTINLFNLFIIFLFKSQLVLPIRVYIATFNTCVTFRTMNMSELVDVCCVISVDK